MHNKSQIAMESVLIYGLVVLVVTLTIGALIYFGVLDFGRYLPDSCVISGEGLLCENYVVSLSGGADGTKNVQLELRNKAGKNVENVVVTVIGEEDAATVWNCGKSKPTTITNGALSGPITMDCNIKIEEGRKIKGRVDVDYNVVGSTITRRASGTIYSTVAS